MIRYLIGNIEDKVVNVDKLTYAGNLDSLTAVSNHDRYHFEWVDICDKAALASVFNQ